MMGRLHVTPSTVASNTTAKPPMPLRIQMPRRSRLLNGTASALDFPCLANELFPDVSLELVEVVVAASYFGGTQVLDRRVVLPGDVAEVLHGALVGPGQSLFALRDCLGRTDEMAIEREAVVEIERRRGLARARVGLPVALHDDVARVLDYRRFMNERPALVDGPADELLIVFDVRLHVREQTRLILQYAIEDLVHQAAIFGLGRLVACPPGVELSVELAIAWIDVIEPVPLVRGEDTEYEREHDQDPGKDVFEAYRVPGEALPRQSCRSPLIQVLGDLRRRQRNRALRRHARLCLRDIVGGNAIVSGGERHEEKARVEKRDPGQCERLAAWAPVVHVPKKASRQNGETDIDDRERHGDQHATQQPEIAALRVERRQRDPFDEGKRGHDREVIELRLWIRRGPVVQAVLLLEPSKMFERPRLILLGLVEGGRAVRLEGFETRLDGGQQTGKGIPCLLDVDLRRRRLAIELQPGQALFATFPALSSESDEVGANLRFGDVERGALRLGIVVTGRVGRLLVDFEGAARHVNELLHLGNSCGQRLFGTHSWTRASPGRPRFRTSAALRQVFSLPQFHS